MIKIKLRIHGHLYWYTDKQQELVIEVEPQTIENILEAVGVPIGEVSFVAINNKKVGFAYVPNDVDTLDIYPVVGGG